MSQVKQEEKKESAAVAAAAATVSKSDWTLRKVSGETADLANLELGYKATGDQKNKAFICTLTHPKTLDTYRTDAAVLPETLMLDELEAALANEHGYSLVVGYPKSGTEGDKLVMRVLKQDKFRPVETVIELQKQRKTDNDAIVERLDRLEKKLMEMADKAGRSAENFKVIRTCLETLNLVKKNRDGINSELTNLKDEQGTLAPGDRKGFNGVLTSGFQRRYISSEFMPETIEP